MDLRDSIRASFGGLTRHKLRASLTTLGIVFGVGAVIAMQAIGEGARREAVSLIEAMGLNNVVVRAKRLDQEAQARIRSDSRGLSLEDMAVLARTLKDVDAVAARRTVKTKAVTVWTNRSDATVYGVSPAYARLGALEVERGVFFDDADDLATAAVAVLGPKAARSLFGFDDPIGQAVKIDKVWVTVIGVLRAKTFAKDEFEGVKIESPDNDIFIPVRTALRRLPVLPHEDPLDEIIVALGGGVRPNEAALVVGEVMDRLHRLVDDWELIVPFALMEQSQKTQHIFNIVMGSIAGISLLVGGIGIMNIMLASVMERTREIGVRRALGARQCDIRNQFLVEALLLAGVGGCLGIAFGHVLSRAVAATADWSTAVSWWSVFVAVGVAAAVGLVSGAYPAIRAARLDPVEALRYE